MESQQLRNSQLNQSIDNGQNDIKNHLKSAFELLKLEQMNKLKSGIDKFDNMLEGGLVKGWITEIYGEAGSGKTQLATTFMLNALKNPNMYNQITLDGRGIYISFNKDISQKRFQKLQESFLKKNGLDPNQDYQENKQLNFYNFTDYQRFCDFLPEIEKIAQTRQLRLIVIDEIANISRSDENKKYKEKILFFIQLTQGLKQIAKEFNFPILIMNSVIQDVNSKKEKKIPAVGSFWASLVNERLKLTREDRKVNDLPFLENKQQQIYKQTQQVVHRKLKVKFSPRLERQHVDFIIDDEGFK